MPTTHPYDLVIGLDRSDRKADLHRIDTRTGTVQKQTVATSPEALHDWLAQLRQDHPQARVALCLEQPAANLIVFLETYAWITLYPINPITLQKFREGTRRLVTFFRTQGRTHPFGVNVQGDELSVAG